MTAESIIEKISRIRTYRYSGAPAVLVAVAAALAACGGPSSPHIAKLDQSDRTTTTSSGVSNGSGTSATTGPKGNATQLLAEWTSCMRSNGDPNQAEPTVDANGAIHVTEPAEYFGTIYGATGNNSSGAGVTCQVYLTDASTALNAGAPLQSPNLTTLDEFADCMRAYGVPNFPDPGALQASTGAAPAASGPDPNSPNVQKASNLCAKRTGAKGLGFGTTLRPGEIEIGGSDGGIREIVTGTEDVPQ